MYVCVIKLLEEMLDNGYPLTTEPNALKAMISPPTTAGRIAAMVSGKSSVSDSLPDGTTSSLPWRKAGVKYTQVRSVGQREVEPCSQSLMLLLTMILE